MREEDSWDDEPYDDEPYDDLDDDSAETLPCPHCGAEIYEDSEQCPVCGNYVTFRTSAWSGRSVWWIVLAVAGVVATVLVLAGVFR